MLVLVQKICSIGVKIFAIVWNSLVYRFIFIFTAVHIMDTMLKKGTEVTLEVFTAHDKVHYGEWNMPFPATNRTFLWVWWWQR